MTADLCPSPSPGPPQHRHESLRPLSPRVFWELLGSMRFAIALLSLICVASAIGTVIQQGQPWVNGVDTFGPYWAEVFAALGLFRIYASAWFLLILGFLVVSTSLCLARNTPKVIADWRSLKLNIRHQALLAFRHRAQAQLPQPLGAAQARVLATLSASGWRVQMQARTGPTASESGVMIAARKGAAGRLGYIAAHGAIVLICTAGLLDGEALVRLQAWSQGLRPFTGGNVEPPNARLSLSNPAYRAQLFVPEGQRSNAAVVTLEQGMLVQPLPFDIELKHFRVEYYDSGMPKRFASDIVVHDAVHGRDVAATVEVNHPLSYEGVTIFQSSFEDGGSQVSLQPLWLDGRHDARSVATTVNGHSIALDAQGQPLLAGHGPQAGDLEVTDLRVINVEDLAQAQSRAQAPLALSGVNLSTLAEHLGSGARSAHAKQLTNIGPSVTYKLRDAAGQAKEFQNYLAPMQIDGQWMYLFGVREQADVGFRYLRVPADEQRSLTGWLHLLAALHDPAMRAQAAARFAQQAGGDRQSLRQELNLSARRALDLFAGEPWAGTASGTDQASRTGAAKGGLQALSDFVEQAVPAAQQQATSTTLVRILDGALWQLYALSRERDGLAPAAADDAHVRAFLSQSVLAISDATMYPASAIWQLQSFVPRQASVFQVTRTPARPVVYLGCVLLIIGVFSMLYVRERRVWVWLQPSEGGTTQLSMALSATRMTLDTDREFEQLRVDLGAHAQATAQTA